MNKFEVIKQTPHLITCDVLKNDFTYVVRKLDKLERDLEQMKMLGNQDTVQIDYVLNAIRSDDY